MMQKGTSHELRNISKHNKTIELDLSISVLYLCTYTLTRSTEQQRT